MKTLTEKTSLTFIDKISFVMIPILAYCVTRMSLTFVFNSVWFSLILIFFASALAIMLYFIYDKRFGYKLVNSNILFLMFYFCLVYISTLFCSNKDYNETSISHLKQIIILVTLWAVYNILLCSDYTTKKFILVWFLGCVLLSSIYTSYVALVGDENIIRNTADGRYDESFLLNYGNYEFIYALVIIYIGLFSFFRYKKQKLNKPLQVFLVLVLISSAFTIVVSGYMTATLVILFFTIFDLIKRNRIIGITIVLVLFLIFREILLILVSELDFLPKVTMERIQDILSGGEDTVEYLGSYGGRFSRFGWSLEIFLENPLFGGYFANTKEKFGMHSEWVDTLAEYGLIASISLLFFWIKTFNSKIKNCGDDQLTRTILKRGYFALVLVGFLNPISMVVTVAPLFVVLPFLNVFIKNC